MFGLFTVQNLEAVGVCKLKKRKTLNPDNRHSLALITEGQNRLGEVISRAAKDSHCHITQHSNVSPGTLAKPAISWRLAKPIKASAKLEMSTSTACPSIRDIFLQLAV